MSAILSCYIVLMFCVAEQAAKLAHKMSAEPANPAAPAGAESAHHGHEHEHEHDHEHGTELHSFIGVSLVLGFVFMLLVDQLSGGGHSHNGGGQLTHCGLVMTYRWLSARLR